jgi:hypothetical protein
MGIMATKRLIASEYLWPGLAKDIVSWRRECQPAKASSQPATAVQPIQVPAARFTHVHVDLAGTLPMFVEGYQYIFTAIDISTSWAEAYRYPLKVVATADCMAALIHGWGAYYGVPISLHNLTP